MTHAPDTISSSARLPGGAMRRLLIALLALVLLASACSGSDAGEAAADDPDVTLEREQRDESDNDTEDQDESEDAEEDFTPQDDDAENDEADDDASPDDAATDDDGTEDDAMEEDAMAGDIGAQAPSAADEGASGSAIDVEADRATVAQEESGLFAQTDDDAEGLFSQPEDDDFIEVPGDSRLQDNRFQSYGYRQFIETNQDPLSTFALDVDTGSYTIARRWLDEGVLPPPESVRVEEFVNAFDFDYQAPRRGLEISVDGGPSPFDRDNMLVRVGVQAESIPDGERPPVALTFIVDTSGSMDRDNRLGLVKDSLEILVDELEDDDTVAIVVYSDSSGVVLEPTPVSDSRRIYAAIDSLESGGSTNLESGLREGYELAADAFRPDGVNRVIIASDGVANAGITDHQQLSDYIRNFADEGIQLVTVGYGMGNFNDTLMEQLADNGDGFYAYVDSRDEAERLFEDELTSTLITAAIDAKIQVEFDPDVVAEYRLIGFENRGVRDSDFRNDSVDAGELGAGHQVTAMYEIRLHDDVDLDDRGEIGEVFLRWEDPQDRDVIEIDEDIDLRDVAPAFEDTAIDFQLATVVTAFAEVMRDNPYADDVDLRNIWVEADRVADEIDTDQADELVDLLAIALDLS